MANRNNPIPATVERIPGYPNTLIIYKAAFSRFYQARARVGKMITRSLKTEIKAHALQRAKDFYKELMMKQASGLPLTESLANFAKAAESLIAEDSARVERGERAETLVIDFTKIYNKDLLPFFQRDNIKSINYQRIQAYVEHLRKREVSSQTIKQHFVCLRKVLKQAHKLDMLDKLPMFPTISIHDNPREWFNDDQFTQLQKTIRKAIADKVKVRGVPITETLLDLTNFMVHTFLRPQDVKVLRNRDITVVQKKVLGKPDTSYLRIMAKGKVVASPVISTPNAVTIYNRIKGAPEEYVFFNQYARGHAMAVMSTQFKYVLEQAKLYKTDDGERTLYSLRHTCITNQLLHGTMPIALVARNCRTSIEMIQRFYGSHAEVERNAHQLHEQIEQGDSLEDFFEEEPA